MVIIIVKIYLGNILMCCKCRKFMWSYKYLFIYRYIFKCSFFLVLKIIIIIYIIVISIKNNIFWINDWMLFVDIWSVLVMLE